MAESGTMEHTSTTGTLHSATNDYKQPTYNYADSAVQQMVGLCYFCIVETIRDLRISEKLAIAVNYQPSFEPQQAILGSTILTTILTR